MPWLRQSLCLHNIQRSCEDFSSALVASLAATQPQGFAKFGVVPPNSSQTTCKIGVKFSDTFLWILTYIYSPSHNPTQTHLIKARTHSICGQVELVCWDVKSKTSSCQKLSKRCIKSEGIVGKYGVFPSKFPGYWMLLDVTLHFGKPQSET